MQFEKIDKLTAKGDKKKALAGYLTSTKVAHPRRLREKMQHTI